MIKERERKKETQMEENAKVIFQKIYILNLKINFPNTRKTTLNFLANEREYTEYFNNPH